MFSNRAEFYVCKGPYIRRIYCNFVAFIQVPLQERNLNSSFVLEGLGSHFSGEKPFV